MSKTLAIAAEVVAVVVAVAAAIPSGGTSLLAAGLGVSAASASAIAAGVGLAAGGIGMLAAKPKAQQVNPTEWKADPQAGIPYVMGYTYVGGNIVYRATSGDNNTYQNLVTVISGAGPIDGFNQFFVDSSFRNVAADGTVDIPDRGNLWMRTQLGHAPEAAALSMAPGSPQGWNANSKLSGYAATVVTLKYDAKGSKTLTSPPQCGWTVRGVRIYDPRLDSTFPGGAGPQRSNDESTWTWSQNPILHALTWLIGRRQNGKLILGVGLSLSGVLMPQMVEAANVADANGWTLGGVVYSTDDKWNVFKQMLQAGGAEPLRLGAQIGCLVNTPRVSLATIGVGDVVGKGTNRATQARRDRINAVVPRYMAEQVTTIPGTSVTTTWAQVGGDPIVVDAWVAFDGRVRQREITYSLVQCLDGHQPTQVAQLARYDIENAREFGPITLPLKLFWMGYRPGDVVTCNLPELGLNGQDVLILQGTLSGEDGTVTIQARSETAGKHPFALGQTLTPPPTPSVSGPALIPVPGATAWAIVAQTVTANGTTVPALVIGGAVDNSTVEGVIFEYRTWGAQPGPWQAAGTNPSNTTGKTINGIQDGTVYQCAVSYQVGPNIGDRLILGPVTAGQTSVPWQTGVKGLAKPADYATNSGDPNSPFGNANVSGPFANGTVGWWQNRVYTLEQAAGSGGTIQQQINELKSQIDNGGGGPDDQLTSRVSSLEAVSRGAGSTGVNLLINPSFGDGLNKWNQGAGSWNVVSPSDVGPFVQCATPNAYLYQDVVASPNTAYSLSANMDPDNAQGCYVKVDWFDNAGRNLGAGQASVYSDGWARGYTADNVLVSPSATAKARIYCCISGGGSGNGRFNQVQFQKGGIASPFRDDAADNSNAARITSEETARANLAGSYAAFVNTVMAQFAGSNDSWLKSQIQTTQNTVTTSNQSFANQLNQISVTISALGSPNLIQNGAFTNGFNGWSGFGDIAGNWSLYDGRNGDVQGYFAQCNIPANDNAGLYYSVSGVQPGKPYCLSFEEANDSGCGGHMVVQWRDQGNNIISFGPESAHGNFGWGNRVNTGPFTAPNGAYYAVVCFYPDVGSGTRRLTRVLFQQSSACTPYVDGASTAALQASVNQQASAIANINGKLQAYYNVTANAGDATAFVTLSANVNGSVTSDVAIGAKSIALYNQSGGNYLKTIVVEDGNVSIYGNLRVAGSVSTMNLKDRSVSNRLLLSGGSQTWSGNGSGSGYTPPSGGGGAGGSRTSQP